MYEGGQMCDVTWLSLGFGLVTVYGIRVRNLSIIIIINNNNN